MFGQNKFRDDLDATDRGLRRSSVMLGTAMPVTSTASIFSTVE